MAEPHQPGLSFWVTVAFTLNYSLGSGFLTLPWAFSQTGTLLGVGVLVLFGCYSMLATFFLLETIDRGRKVLSLTGNHTFNSYSSIESQRNPLSGGTESQLDHMPSSNQSSGTTLEITFSDPEVTFADPEDFSLNKGLRKLEINELCDMFLGPYGKASFTLLIAIYMTGTLWAYGTVFANSFAAHLNIGEWSYFIYLLIFSAVVIPASLLEFSEQVSVQVALSVFRVLMVVIMCITCLMDRDGDDFQLDQTSSNTGADSTWNKVSWPQMYCLLPVAAYSYIFHHSVPSLEYPMRDKRKMVQLFVTAVGIAMILYILVGVVVSAYFNGNTDQSSNLNWSSYRGPYGQRALGRCIAFFVVIFPAFDVASAFPLNAYTLGNNLMTAFYGADIDGHAHDLRRKLLLCRGLAAGLPLLGALVNHDLGHITDHTGLAAFVLAFVFPPLLAYASAKRMQDMGVNFTSVHSNFFTRNGFQILLLLSGIVALLYVGAALLEEDFGG